MIGIEAQGESAAVWKMETMTKANDKATALRNDILAIKRERILSEAVDLFYENGYLSTNVDAIAQQLGATKPFVYYHFKSKIELLSDICSRLMLEALDVAEAAAGADAGPVEKLAQFAVGFTKLVLERHKHVSIYFREELNLPDDVKAAISDMRRKIDYRLRGILKEGVQTGEFHFSNVAVASQIVSGMVSYTFAWYDEARPLSKEAIIRQMLEQVLMSVGVDRARLDAVQKPQIA